MPELSRWQEMDHLGSRTSFGAFRASPKPRMKPASKILLVIACLSASVLIICFTTLSITKGRGNNKIEALSKKTMERSTKYSSVSNSTLIERKIDDHTLHQSETVKPFKFPEDSQNRIKFPDQEDETDLYEAKFVSRQGKTMESPIQKGQKEKKQYYSPHHYSDFYPQLENYKNPNNLKSVQDVMRYVQKRPHLAIGPDGRPAVKFTGVYLKTPDDEYDDLLNENSHNPSLNGQPYASDPFKHYKPSHPSEINHLATFSSDVDTGPRFSNKIVRPTKIPSDPITMPTQTQITQAIFHPFETFPTSQPDKRQKPLKILLDIYPVMPEIEHGHGYPHGKKTRYKQPSYHSTPTPPNSNRMIVHLNLYPKRSKQKRTHYLTSLVPGGGNMEERMFDGSGEFDEDYRTVRFQGEASRVDMSDVGYPTENMDESSFREDREELTTEAGVNYQEENSTEIYEFRNKNDNGDIGDYVFEQEEMEGQEEQDRLLRMKLQKLNVTNDSVA